MIALPIVARLDIRGTAVDVRAVPYGLLRAAAKADTNEAKADAAARIVAACATYADGTSVNPDDLLPEDLAGISLAAMTRAPSPGVPEPDFTTPPAASASGGSESTSIPPRQV